MARGIRTAVGLSYLSSIYTCLDTLTDKKPPQDKKGELQIHYMLGWLATYCPKTYNTQIEVTNDMPLLCKIAGVDPSILSLKSAHELFRRADEQIEYVLWHHAGFRLAGN